MNPTSFNLGKLRHDLRTPINQIIGYCELLIEDDELPMSYKNDLEKVKAGGWQLLATLNNYLSDQNFARLEIDAFRLQEDLRTPVDHIIGFTEILMEIAEEESRLETHKDLQRIHQAAAQWLQMMESHLLPRVNSQTAEAGLVTPPVESQAQKIQPTSPFLAKERQGMGERILIAEDDPFNRDILARRVQRFGYQIETACNGLEAWEKLQSEAFDLVLLDMVMPEMEGYEVLQRMRADSRLHLIPVLMISGMDQESSIVRCIETGADDYLTKPLNPVFLKARIGACLDKKRLRDREQRTHAALVESQRKLAEELAEAGRYVSCLLPQSLEHPDIRVDWHFQSCSQLGGDGFGYRWIDPAHWGFFLFDVCGHGVGAALLSISVLNLMRTLSLPNTDFRSPKSVLEALNLAFPMESNNEQYFTFWYGVYCPATRKLSYGSAGHPAALCLEGANLSHLRTKGPPIGCMEGARFQEDVCILSKPSRLIVLSDGVYELEKTNGSTATLEEFSQWLVGQGENGDPRSAFNWAQSVSVREKMDDDFSIMDIRFL